MGIAAGNTNPNPSDSVRWLNENRETYAAFRVEPGKPNPTAPVLSILAYDHDSVDLSWVDSFYETSYLILRRDNNAGSYNEVGSGAS